MADIVPNDEQPRAHRGRGSVALGIAIAVTLISATGVGLTRAETRAAAATTVATAPTPPATAMAAGDAGWRAPRPARPTRAKTAALPRSCGDQEARVVTFRVSVEEGLGLSRARFAEQVLRVLCDRRSWIAGGAVRFRYDPDGAVLISLRSPYETERRCLALVGLSVREKWSCAARGAGEAVINADRWFEGSPTWDGSVARYRHLVINHEVGHLLGQRHRGCGGAGGRAPVMMQQSKGLGGCEPNPWPLRSEVRTVR